MIDIPNMVLIGATGRNVGKTTLACELIERLRSRFRVIGVKVTAADDEQGNARTGSKGRGCCDDLRGPFEIIEEQNAAGNKDTCLMLRAQAAKVYWVKSLRSHLAEAVKALLARVGRDCVLVCESTGLRSVVRPGLFLLADHAKTARLCRKTPSSARERAIFSSGKACPERQRGELEAGDVDFIVDAAGCGQADNSGCLDPTVAATAADKTIQEKGPLEARSDFSAEPRSRPSAEQVRQWVDRVVCFEGQGFDIDLDNIRYDAERWYCPAKASCIILAGGRSRRMGQDKSLLPLKGKPMIQHVLDQVRPHFEEIIVSSNTPEVHQFPGIKTVSDHEQGRGPLMGICTALQACSHDTSFVVACDMPNIDITLMRQMLRQAYRYDAVIPRANQRFLEPLFAVYNRPMLYIIEESLAEGKNTVQDVVTLGNVLYVDLSEEQQRALLNLNTKQEYTRFREKDAARQAEAE